ncbi:MAG: 30S ribosomal protein S13 [Candidatus Harrisonbacteria bacterium RIFCSPLOWO2_02_FULL_41_11]|uniref:Small ribosomal subunit protein uS13 n=1 Tax=Candidatus Harrisonbacteria bacterium RIFCSPHIGHO2_02_FULL_42_16 TaxID=1798404 RepID=A0A1G1ZL44_9BACT|nr:MAG: 30S ribosomal protein S13 [Candidatus Harrisonbacteria bacterium RIFCSPHIGHO2_02_FULL_42_16]OGY66536.1 MAG: 30S ribosomal protein S13 [Candidatus Harrisonbacteria bacterium RIFCSPLOWO2_02_FULL_41_11]
MILLGVKIPDNKRTEISLTYVYGIGRSSAQKILSAAKIDLSKRVKDLTPEEVKKIKEFVEKNYKVEGELRQIVKQNINLLKDYRAYRGIRHLRHLPVRGQRTKTNSRTVRGNVRKTAGSGKRKIDLK